MCIHNKPSTKYWSLLLHQWWRHDQFPYILEVHLVKTITPVGTQPSVILIHSFLWSLWILSTLFPPFPLCLTSPTGRDFFLTPSPPSKRPQSTSWHRKWEELSGVTSSTKKEEIKIKIAEISAKYAYYSGYLRQNKGAAQKLCSWNCHSEKQTERPHLSQVTKTLGGSF